MRHRHQNQLRYRHVEDDNTQCAEITGATKTSPITGDSPPVFPHQEESAEDAEMITSDSIPATGEIREEHVVAHYGIVDLRSDTPK